MILSVNRVLFEKILICLLALSWVNLPRMLYRQMSWDSMTAYHGNGLIPYFLPVILLLLGYLYCRSDFFLKSSNHILGFSNMMINTITDDDKLFLLLVFYILLLESFNIIFFNTNLNFRILLPLFWGHIYYLIYKNFQHLSVINNVKNFFLKSLVFWFFCMMVLQILMPSGEFRDISYGFINGILFDITQTDGRHQGFISYSAVIFLFIMLYYKRDINIPLFYTIIAYASIFYVLMINQTRGAILPAIILLAFFLVSGRRTDLKNLYSIIVVGIVISIFILLNDSHRLISLGSSGIERLFLIQKTVLSLFDSLLFGLGADNARNLRFGPQNHAVHSAWILFLVSYGILGFIILIVYYVKIFLNKISAKNIIGLFIIFVMFLSETYLYYSIYLIPALAIKVNKDNFLFQDRMKKNRRNYYE